MINNKFNIKNDIILSKLCQKENLAPIPRLKLTGLAL